MSIHMVIDRVTGAQVGRLYPSAHEARTARPGFRDTTRYEVTTVEQFCLASDWCPEPAVTIADLPGVQEYATHHVPVCADFVKDGRCKIDDLGRGGVRG